jgi:hypothetical protein
LIFIEFIFEVIRLLSAIILDDDLIKPPTNKFPFFSVDKPIFTLPLKKLSPVPI